ncbi:MAG: hypothetical protein Q7I97_02345 [Thermovirgaceae bacterium]|nr:hypothetical protein [Thermovirgaceae bacterium]
MTRPLRIEFPGTFYHVTSRRNEHYHLMVEILWGCPGKQEIRDVDEKGHLSG